MQLQIASDLHLELLQGTWPGERIIRPAAGADVLVVAGDISADTRAFDLFADWPVPVIYVAGNHEFYRGSIPALLAKLRKRSSPNSNIHFLENDTVAIGGTRFIGTTLWTDYNLQSHLAQSSQMEYAEQRLRDHKLITNGRSRFTARSALVRHKSSRAWIKAELDKPWAGNTVVVTHHGPHPLSIHNRFAGDPINSAFCSDLSEVLFSAHAPTLWIHGHTHDSFDYKVGKSRVIANPAGYIENRHASPSEFWFENTSFNRELVVEV